MRVTLPPFIRLEPVTTCAHRRVFHSCVNALVPAYTVLSVSVCLSVCAFSTRECAQHLGADDRVEQHDALRIRFPEHPLHHLEERAGPGRACGGGLTAKVGLIV